MSKRKLSLLFKIDIDSDGSFELEQAQITHSSSEHKNTNPPECPLLDTAKPTTRTTQHSTMPPLGTMPHPNTMPPLGAMPNPGLMPPIRSTLSQNLMLPPGVTPPLRQSEVNCQPDHCYPHPLASHLPCHPEPELYPRPRPGMLPVLPSFPIPPKHSETAVFSQPAPPLPPGARRISPDQIPPNAQITVQTWMEQMPIDFVCGYPVEYLIYATIREKNIDLLLNYLNEQPDEKTVHQLFDSANQMYAILCYAVHDPQLLHMVLSFFPNDEARIAAIQKAHCLTGYNALQYSICNRQSLEQLLNLYPSDQARAKAIMSTWSPKGNDSLYSLVAESPEYSAIVQHFLQLHSQPKSYKPEFPLPRFFKELLDGTREVKHNRHHHSHFN